MNTQLSNAKEIRIPGPDHPITISPAEGKVRVTVAGRHFRPLCKGTLIANVKMDRDRGNRLIAEGLADLVAFGRPYIANPDLVQRFADNTPLAEVDWETVYASGPHGYSDYPAYESSEHNTRS
jgi:N-ethylmaleimide reductase